MQEVFEEFAQRVALQSKDAIRILDELKEYKEANKGMKKIYSSADIDDIYKVLESENPLNDDGVDND